MILLFSGTPLASSRERGLARKDGGKRQDTAIQEHLAQLEIHPVPDEERLEGAEEQSEGENARRRQVRDTYADLGPLGERVIEPFGVLRREEDGTYQTEQRDPWCEHKGGKEGRDDLGGELLLGMEGVGYERLGVEGRFVRVGCRRGGCRDVEVKEVERRWVVYERAEDQGDGERAVSRRWQGRRRTSHVLREKKRRERRDGFLSFVHVRARIWPCRPG